MLTSYDDLANQIIAEHNFIRANPKSYIPLLEEHLIHFKEDILSRPGEVALRTNEGKAAYLEAIEFLKKVQPVPALTNDNRLTQAALDHCEDIGFSGAYSHVGEDGSTVSDRIEKYCEWDHYCTESIEFGSKLAKDVIISFVVDDGLNDRPHRKNLFSPNFKYIGVAVGAHKETEVVTVVDYVGGIRNFDEESPDVKNYVAHAARLAEERRNKTLTKFQEEDPDAPDNTVSVETKQVIKRINGEDRKIRRKIFILSDGSKHIVETDEQ